MPRTSARTRSIPRQLAAVVFLLFPLATLSACTSWRSTAQSVGAIRRSDATRVRRVTWEGVGAIPSSELTAVTQTRGSSYFPWSWGSELDEAQLEDDIAQVAALYRSSGFYTAHVDYAVHPAEKPGEVEVVYRVDEGMPVRVGSVQVAYADGALGAPVVGGSLLELGEPFEIVEYRAAKQRLLADLGEASHLAPQLDGGADVDVEAERADIHWSVDPGPRVVAGETRVRGLERVEREVVLREIAWSEGEPLRTSQLEKTRTRLAELGLFRSVVVEPVRDADLAFAGEQCWPVEVRVEERSPRTVQAGLGYGTSEKVRARVSWLHRNLLGSGRKLELAARYSSLETGALAGLDWPHAFGTSVTGDLSIDLFREQNPTFDARRAQFEAGVALPLGVWKGRLAYRLDSSRTSGVNLATQRELDGTEQNTLVGLLEAKLEQSTATPAEDPTTGWRAELTGGFASHGFGSEIDFARFEADARRYWTWLGVVAAVRLRAGVIQPLGSFGPDDIPLTERFYAGGGESVRGFDYQRLGPVDSNDDPLGGTSVLIGSTELRFPVRDRLGGVVFVDAGSVDRDPFNFSSDLRYSTGIGFRLATPVGPVRVDFAQLLNPPDDFDRFRVHLSIGQAF